MVAVLMAMQSGWWFIIAVLVLCVNIWLQGYAGKQYLTGVIEKKEYRRRQIIGCIPTGLLPAWVYIAVTIYYLIVQDSDPLGYLWVVFALPVTAVFLIASIIVWLVVASIKKKRG